MQIFRIWQHPQSADESTVFGPRQLIASIGLLNFVVSFVYLITNLRLHIDPRANLIQIFSSLVTLIFLRLFRSHKPAAHIFLATALFAVCSLILTFVSFPYTILMWLPVYTILSVYLVGMSSGGFWSLIAVSASAGIVMYGHHFNKQPVPILAEDLPIISAMTLFLTCGCAFAASAFFAKSIQHLLRTQEKQNEELKEQNKTIQLYAQDKALLVSIVVHDIATPLTIILHASDSAMKHPAEAQNHLQRIQRASRIMEEIARGVREFQSVESGKKSVRLGVVDLRTVFERANFIFEERLQEKSLSLKFVYDDVDPLLVVAEEKSLSNSVINNLISNAIKFSYPGQSIEIRAVEDATHVLLSVRDFGVGMPATKTRNIFSKNATTSSKGTMGERGTGFGLPISKAYMDKFGGEIQVESIEENKNSPDHGTTFTLRLLKADPDDVSERLLVAE